MTAHPTTAHTGEGYVFDASRKNESATDAVLNRHVTAHYGHAFSEAKQPDQIRGIDYWLAQPQFVRPVGYEMKTEGYAFNQFFELFQLYRDRREIDLGWVPKAESDYLLMFNLAAGYLVLAHRLSWLSTAASLIEKRLAHFNQPISTVLNDTRLRKGTLSHASYGISVAYKELLTAYSANELAMAPVFVFDFRKVLPEAARRPLLLQTRFNNNIKHAGKLDKLMADGARDFAEISTLLERLAHPMHPFEDLATLMATLPPDNSVEHVVQVLSPFMTKACAQSVTRQSANLAAQLPGNYTAQSRWAAFFARYQLPAKLTAQAPRLLPSNW